VVTFVVTFVVTPTGDSAAHANGNPARCGVLTIARLGAGGRSADYYLDRKAGCEEEPERQRSGADVDYYGGDESTPGRWLGGGAEAAGLAGAVDAVGEQVLRGLLAGCDADGGPLVKPVLRADPRGLVPARVLVAAVGERAASAGADPSVLIGDERLGDAYAASMAAVAVDRRSPRRPRAALAADVAGQIATAVGLDPHAIFMTADGSDAYAAALQHVGDRVDVRRAGLDLTFSAPKSVSTLFALGGPEVAGEVRAAHRVAVEQSVQYIEGLSARAARGHHGPAGEGRWTDTDGWLAAAFEHVTSRADDPQLHTHVVVPNVVRGVDGRWSAFDTREVYRQALTGGYLYQAVLRGELTRRLGVRWGRVRRGVAEIDGVPAELRRLFSVRRGEVVEHLERTGRTGPKAAQIAALRTRRRKSKAAEPTLRERWHARAADAGFDPATVLTATLRRAADRLAVVTGQVAARVLGPHGVTERRSSFDRRDLLRAVCEAIPAGAPVTVDDLRTLATATVRDRRVVALLPGAPASSRRYSTGELLTTEQTALWAAGARGEEMVGRVDRTLVEAALAGCGLSAEQESAVRRVTGSGAGVDVVVGPAGAGKTAALSAARQAWTAAGLAVRGVALAALAARTLQDGAGIPATSLTRLLRAIDRDGLAEVLPPGGVLVVDEASMVATRQLARLIDLTAQARTKLVLVGDPAQLPELEAGGLFAALARALPSVRLSGNVRQREPWEREALLELRDGDVLDAFGRYQQHGRLHLADSTGEVREQIVGAYLDSRTTDGTDVLMLTSTRADARTLNRLVRQRLLDQRELRGDGMQVRVRGRRLDFRVGDAVLVTVNDYRRGLYNGTRGVVTAADNKAVTLRAGVQQVTLPREWVAAGLLEHGYALTCHRAQGVTVDVALLYGSRSLSRESGYVGMSRGRLANHVFATWEALVPELDTDADGPREPRPATTERTELTEAALVQRLETRTAQRLATEQIVRERARCWWTADPGQGEQRALGR
jgi:conjugative relaxase-like TrwC/TraI family protein